MDSGIYEAFTGPSDGHLAGISRKSTCFSDLQAMSGRFKACNMFTHRIAAFTAVLTHGIILSLSNGPIRAISIGHFALLAGMNYASK
jgi:hypothetical protein